MFCSLLPFRGEGSRREYAGATSSAIFATAAAGFMEIDSDWSWNYGTSFKPDPTSLRFLMRYNLVLTNRGMISCFKCSRNLPSSGYQLVDSSVAMGIVVHVW